MLKQVVWTHFEPVVPRFGPRKIPKCPEKRLVQHMNWPNPFTSENLQPLCVPFNWISKTLVLLTIV